MRARRHRGQGWLVGELPRVAGCSRPSVNPVACGWDGQAVHPHHSLRSERGRARQPGWSDVAGRAGGASLPGLTTLPGLSNPRGSKASFSVRIKSSATGSL
jgi:hypothetical protein